MGQEDYKSELRREVARQMQEAGVRFNVDSDEAEREQIGLAADYIADIYAEDGETAEERVASWLIDTRMNFADDLVRRPGKGSGIIIF